MKFKGCEADAIYPIMSGQIPDALPFSSVEIFRLFSYTPTLTAMESFAETVTQKTEAQSNDKHRSSTKYLFIFLSPFLRFS